MAIGSGIGASFGGKAESTYGTGVTVDRWLPSGESFFVRPEIETAYVTGLAAGRIGPGIDQVIVGRHGVGGWAGAVPTTKFGLWLAQLMGTSPTPAQQAATAAYLQAFTYGDNFGRSVTCQAGVPLTSGTVVPYTGTGGKVTAIEFSQDTPSSILKANMEFWFQNVVDSVGLAAPSYTTHGVISKLDIRLGTFGAETTVTGFRSTSVKIERVLDLDMATGTPGANREPIMVQEGFKVSGTLSPDFVAKGDFADRFLAGSTASLVLDWTGSLIASTYFNGLKVRVPKAGFRDAVPGVDGPEVVKGSVAFEGMLDTTNGLVLLDYMSTDTTQ